MKPERVKQLTGVDGRTRCHRCKITARQAAQRPATRTGIDHPVYKDTRSFYSNFNGTKSCAPCHKEQELENLLGV